VQAIGGAHRRYRVTSFQVVRWDGFAAPRNPARPLLALVTCYPFGATEHGPLRFVVWAEALRRGAAAPSRDGPPAARAAYFSVLR
jgi:sortase A